MHANSLVFSLQALHSNESLSNIVLSQDRLRNLNILIGGKKREIKTSLFTECVFLHPCVWKWVRNVCGVVLVGVINYCEKKHE